MWKNVETMSTCQLWKKCNLDVTFSVGLSQNIPIHLTKIILPYGCVILHLYIFISYNIVEYLVVSMFSSITDCDTLDVSD